MLFAFISVLRQAGLETSPLKLLNDLFHVGSDINWPQISQSIEQRCGELQAAQANDQLVSDYYNFFLSECAALRDMLETEELQELDTERVATAQERVQVIQKNLENCLALDRRQQMLMNYPSFQETVKNILFELAQKRHQVLLASALSTEEEQVNHLFNNAPKINPIVSPEEIDAVERTREAIDAVKLPMEEQISLIEKWKSQSLLLTPEQSALLSKKLNGADVSQIEETFEYRLADHYEVMQQRLKMLNSLIPEPVIWNKVERSLGPMETLELPVKEESLVEEDDLGILGFSPKVATSDQEEDPLEPAAPLTAKTSVGPDSDRLLGSEEPLSPEAQLDEADLQPELPKESIEKNPTPGNPASNSESVSKEQEEEVAPSIPLQELNEPKAHPVVALEESGSKLIHLKSDQEKIIPARKVPTQPPISKSEESGTKNLETKSFEPLNRNKSDSAAAPGADSAAASEARSNARSRGASSPSSLSSRVSRRASSEPEQQARAAATAGSAEKPAAEPAASPSGQPKLEIREGDDSASVDFGAGLERKQSLQRLTKHLHTNIHNKSLNERLNTSLSSDTLFIVEPGQPALFKALQRDDLSIISCGHVKLYDVPSIDTTHFLEEAFASLAVAQQPRATITYEEHTDKTSNEIQLINNKIEGKIEAQELKEILSEQVTYIKETDNVKNLSDEFVFRLEFESEASFQKQLEGGHTQKMLADFAVENPTLSVKVVIKGRGDSKEQVQEYQSLQTLFKSAKVEPKSPIQPASITKGAHRNKRGSSIVARVPSSPRSWNSDSASRH